MNDSDDDIGLAQLRARNPAHTRNFGLFVDASLSKCDGSLSPWLAGWTMCYNVPKPAVHRVNDAVMQTCKLFIEAEAAAEKLIAARIRTADLFVDSQLVAAHLFVLRYYKRRVNSEAVDASEVRLGQLQQCLIQKLNKALLSRGTLEAYIASQAYSR